MSKQKISIPEYTLVEELINSITHGIGAILSIWGLIMLTIKASKVSALATVCSSLYGCTLIILYTMSCIYHALSKNLTGKKVLRILDHCNVYLLVYGTIIPISLLAIGGAKGWALFGMVTFVTTLGIVISSTFLEKVQVVEVLCHLINGWGTLFFVNILLQNMGYNGVMLLIAGGVMYTLGSILYGIGSKKKYMHCIFHVFCLLGSILQYFAIYFYVL